MDQGSTPGAGAFTEALSVEGWLWPLCWGSGPTIGPNLANNRIQPDTTVQPASGILDGTLVTKNIIFLTNVDKFRERERERERDIIKKEFDKK